MSNPLALYAALRRDLSSPPGRRIGEAARVPLDGRACPGKVRRGKQTNICGGRVYRMSRNRGPVCAACGRSWPTKVVVESVRGTRNGVPREREMDMAAEIGRLVSRLAVWPRRVANAWAGHCETCERAVPHVKGRWRRSEVAEHLRAHYPRAIAHTTPWRVQELYDQAQSVVGCDFAVIEAAYRGRD